MYVSTTKCSKFFKTPPAFNLGFARERVKMFSHFKCLHGQHNTMSQDSTLPMSYRFSGPDLGY
jgi:hypothetical protein